MTRYSLTIQERHFNELRRRVLPPSGHECVAYLLCGRSTIQRDPWDKHPEVRFLSREIVSLAPEDLISSSPDNVRTRTATFALVLKRVRDIDAVLPYVHGHPGGYEGL